MTKTGAGMLEIGNANNDFSGFTGGLYIVQGTFAGNGQNGNQDFANAMVSWRQHPRKQQ